MVKLLKLASRMAATVTIIAAGSVIAFSAAAQDRGNFIASIRDQVGIYYVFRDDCGPCKIESPIISRFSQRYGISVHAISLDGSRSEVFANSRPDNGRLATLGFTSKVTPAFLIFQKPSDAVAGAQQGRNDGIRPCNNPRGCLSFLGAGTMSEQELADHIFNLLAVNTANGS